MLQVTSAELWPRLAVLSKRRGARQAAVAFVSSDNPLAFRAGDTLIVNASDEAVGAGQTSAKILSAAFDRGAALLAIPVTRSGSGRGAPRKSVSIRGGRNRIIGLSGDPVYPGNVEAIESVSKTVAHDVARGEVVDWFWWPGTSRFVRVE